LAVGTKERLRDTSKGYSLHRQRIYKDSYLTFYMFWQLTAIFREQHLKLL